MQEAVERITISDNGLVFVTSQGQPVAGLQRTESGGSLVLFDSGGQNGIVVTAGSAARVGIDGSRPDGTVMIVNPEANTGVWLNAVGGSQGITLKRDGKDTFQIAPDGTTHALKIFSSAGSPIVELGFEQTGGRLSLSGPDGTSFMTVKRSPENGGELMLRGPANNVQSLLWGSGRLSLQPANSDPVVFPATSTTGGQGSTTGGDGG